MTLGTFQSYRVGAYLIVVGPTGKTLVHFGSATGPLAHQADTLGQAMAWVNSGPVELLNERGA